MMSKFCGYLEKCREEGRLATLAGFRASMMMTGSRYDKFCRENDGIGDVIRSFLIDEAVNCRSANPAANVKCVLAIADEIYEGDDTEYDVDLADGE